MQAAASKKLIGCVGKCTSGLTNEELDRLSDSIYATLNNPRSREIFKKYLEQRDLRDAQQCLELFETCSDFIARREYLARDLDIDSLLEDVEIVQEMVEDLDIREMDMHLIGSFKEALKSRASSSLLAVLEETKDRTRSHLSTIHESFKRYVSEPCPLTK